MLQQLVRRLVFDVPQLTEYCKMPIQVSLVNSIYKYATIQKFGLVRFVYVFCKKNIFVHQGCIYLNKMTVKL